MVLLACLFLSYCIITIIKIKKWKHGFRIRYNDLKNNNILDEFVGYQAYVDDIVLICEPNQLDELINLIEEWA